MQAFELMTSPAQVVTADESINLAALVMRAGNIGFLPVVHDFTHMQLCGVITDRDIAVRHTAENHGPHCLVKHHMTKAGLCAAHQYADVADVMHRMRYAQVRRMPVIGAEHSVVGVIALEDIVTALGSAEPAVSQLLQRISEPAGTAA